MQQVVRLQAAASQFGSLGYCEKGIGKQGDVNPGPQINRIVSVIRKHAFVGGKEALEKNTHMLVQQLVRKHARGLVTLKRGR